MCRSCANHHPSRHEPCAFCGELRHVTARSSAGPECGRCRWRRMRSTVFCVGCQRTARPSAGQAGVCERCAGERVGQICTECGAEELNYTVGRCAACSTETSDRGTHRGWGPGCGQHPQRLSGRARGEPEAAHHAELDGLRRQRQPRIPDRAAADRRRAAADPPGARHARSLDHRSSPAQLVRYGALPERSERAAGLALLIDSEVLRVPDGPDRVHLRAFATWKVHHDLARKEGRGTASRNADCAAAQSASPPTCSSGSPNTTSRSPPSNNSISTGG